MSGLIQVGMAVLSTALNAVTKKILVQLGDDRGAPDSDNAEWWQHVGFASLPSIPSPGKASAQVVCVKGGDRDVCTASQDLRGLELYGSLKPGETCVYAAGETGTAQGRMLLKQNGSVNVYTRKGNTSSGAGMGIFVNPDDDSISILNSVGCGLIIKGTNVYLTTKDAALKLEGSAASLISKAQTQVDGASIVIGSTAVPLVNAALKGPTGVSGSASLKTLIE